jgi:hypothetical protein
MGPGRVGSSTSRAEFRRDREHVGNVATRSPFAMTGISAHAISALVRRQFPLHTNPSSDPSPTDEFEPALRRDASSVLLRPGVSAHEADLPLANANSTSAVDFSCIAFALVFPVIIRDFDCTAGPGGPSKRTSGRRSTSARHGESCVRVRRGRSPHSSHQSAAPSLSAAIPRVDAANLLRVWAEA